MRLTEGAHAPDFLRQDLDDTSIALGEYRGRHVLLSFYRFSTCPFCNLRVREVAAVTDDLIARGVYPLAVFHSSAQAMRKQLLGDPLPFPVLPDPGMSLYADYDVERSWAGVLRGMKRLGVLARAVLRGHLPTPSDWRVNGMPADILIGPDGAVVRAYYGRDMGDHLPLDTVFELVSADTDAAPVGRTVDDESMRTPRFTHGGNSGGQDDPTKKTKPCPTPSTFRDQPSSAWAAPSGAP